MKVRDIPKAIADTELPSRTKVRQFVNSVVLIIVLGVVALIVVAMNR